MYEQNKNCHRFNIGYFKEAAEKLGIIVVPLAITINGETYLDRVDLEPAEFIENMSSSKELPKSSQPSTGAFLEVYDRLGKRAMKSYPSI